VSETETDVTELWNGVKSHLTTDTRITPQLWGFLDLVEPRGVMAGVCTSRYQMSSLEECWNSGSDSPSLPL